MGFRPTEEELKSLLLEIDEVGTLLLLLLLLLLFLLVVLILLH